MFVSRQLIPFQVAFLGNYCWSRPKHTSSRPNRSLCDGPRTWPITSMFRMVASHQTFVSELLEDGCTVRKLDYWLLVISTQFAQEALIHQAHHEVGAQGELRRVCRFTNQGGSDSTTGIRRESKGCRHGRHHRSSLSSSTRYAVSTLTKRNSTRRSSVVITPLIEMLSPSSST